MKGYNSLLGSHYDHYYLEYDSFYTDDIDAEVFEVDEGNFTVNKTWKTYNIFITIYLLIKICMNTLAATHTAQVTTQGSPNRLPAGQMCQS